MSANDEYARLVLRLTQLGIYTSRQPHGEFAERVVCATHGSDWGIGGKSFWVTVRNGVWFIVSWAPHFYRVPERSDIVDVVEGALQLAVDQYYDVPTGVKAQYDLVEIEEEEFYPDGWH